MSPAQQQTPVLPSRAVNTLFTKKSFLPVAVYIRGPGKEV